MTMELATCLSIKGALVEFLVGETEVFATDNYCVVSLPLKTLDGRTLEIHVEPTVTDLVIVNDAGKTSAELFSHGIHLTDSKVSILQGLARRYGVVFEGGAFATSVRKAAIQEAVLAIAQCANLAMFELLRNKPVIEEEPVFSRAS